MNDAQYLRDMMVCSSKHSTDATVVRMYQSAIEACKDEARKGYHKCWWSVEEFHTCDLTLQLNKALSQLRAQSFDTYAVYTPNRKRVNIDWSSQDHNVCDATRMRYLSIVHGDDPIIDAAHELYAKAMILCTAAAVNNTHTIYFAEDELSKGDHQSIDLLHIGWEQMIKMFNDRGFEAAATYQCPNVVLVSWKGIDNE